MGGCSCEPGCDDSRHQRGHAKIAQREEHGCYPSASFAAEEAQECGEDGSAPNSKRLSENLFRTLGQAGVAEADQEPLLPKGAKSAHCQEREECGFHFSAVVDETLGLGH
jgi:hypothetical protein